MMAIIPTDDLYSRRLCRLVAQEMDRRLRCPEDPQDIIQAAIMSLAHRLKVNRFHVNYLGELWELLVTITQYRLGTQSKQPRAEERPAGNGTHFPFSRTFKQRQSGAEDVICTWELIQRTLAGLDPVGAEVFFLRLVGFERSAIAALVGRTQIAVKYSLDRIRERLARMLEGMGHTGPDV